MFDAPQWRSTSSSAARLGVTPGTLRGLVNGGEVVAQQVGKLGRYWREDLDEFLDAVRVVPTVE